MKKVVFTEVYKPFRMGGRVRPMVGCEMTLKDRKELDKGFFGYVITLPSGSERVIEEKSGGFVGSSLRNIREDIKNCDDISLMEKQVEDGIEMSKDVEIVSEEEFLRTVDNES